MKKHGGKREGAGPPTGPRTDNVKMGISISRTNANWLRKQKDIGRNISRLIDAALDFYICQSKDNMPWETE